MPVSLFALFSLNFGLYSINGDAKLYLTFVQRLCGDVPDSAPNVYGFGIGLLSAPFYALGRLVQMSGVAGSFGSALPIASLTLASTAFVVLAWVLSSILLRRLGMPYPELSVALAVLGTPVWYYASFQPLYAHPADAALFALIALLTLTLWRQPSTRHAVMTGAAIALAMTVRPFNLALLVGLCGVLAARARFSNAIAVGATAVTAYGLLLLIPVLAHAQFGGLGVSSELGFYPLSPLKMLFTDHRGLFVWTPVSFLAVVGVGIALRRRDLDGYLIALSSMVTCLLLFYMGFKVWDGGWSFSSRFLASPVAFYAIGISLLFSFVQKGRRTLLICFAVLCAAWSVFVGMNHAFGFADQPDGAIAIVRPYIVGARPPAEFVKRAWAYSRVRHVVE